MIIHGKRNPIPEFGKVRSPAWLRLKRRQIFQNWMYVRKGSADPHILQKFGQGIKVWEWKYSLLSWWDAAYDNANTVQLGLLNSKVQTARIERTGRGGDSGYFLYLIERDITRLEYDLRWRDITLTFDDYQRITPVGTANSKDRMDYLRSFENFRIPAFTSDPDKAEGVAHHGQTEGILADQVDRLPAWSSQERGKGIVRVIRPDDSIFIPIQLGKGYPTQDGVEMVPGVPMGFYRRRIDAMVAWEDFLKTLIPHDFMPLLNLGRWGKGWDVGIRPELELVRGAVKFPYETRKEFKSRARLQR